MQREWSWTTQLHQIYWSYHDKDGVLSPNFRLSSFCNAQDWVICESSQPSKRQETYLPTEWKLSMKSSMTWLHPFIEPTLKELDGDQECGRDKMDLWSRLVKGWLSVLVWLFAMDGGASHDLCHVVLGASLLTEKYHGRHTITLCALSLHPQRRMVLHWPDLQLSFSNTPLFCVPDTMFGSYRHQKELKKAEILQEIVP